MTCPCDIAIFPQPLPIPAGLGAGTLQKARALGIFPDWRRSLLAAIAAEPTLDAWRAREKHDLGLMLVEMGAYVFDVCAFYDALVAGEGFLDSAQLTGAQRRLVALLGYVPRPAVGSRAWLAAIAEGQRVISLPRGTAFSSGEFNGNLPQVFELDAATNLDPRINRFTVDRVAMDAIPASIQSVLVDPASVRVRVGEPVVLDFGGTLRTARISGLAPVALRSRAPALRMSFSTAVAVPAGAKYSTLTVLGGGGSSGLWKLGQIGTDTETAISGSDILLESRADARAGDIVLFIQGSELEARRIVSTIERQRTLLATLTSTIKDAGNVVIGSVESPPVTQTISRISVDSPLSWSSTDAAKIVVRHPLSVVARVLVPLKDTLAHDDPISIPGLVDPPRVTVSRLLLEDVHQEGVATAGSLSATTHTAAIDAGEDWGKTLTAPVALYGNVLEVSRGKSVAGEQLGVGDGSRERQTFKLGNKPLTYLSAPTPSGIKTTLSIRVGGVLWHEVESFYGKKETDRVYIVRQDDAGDSHVTFGGGARLPTGAIVTADYRFGAGAAQPPAGSISQLAKPVVGVNSVRNVLPAFGGADAESSRELATYAPRSALLLGRAISLPDLEAAAITTPGVQAARAMWRWDESGMRAVAQIQYIGAASLRPAIHARLRALCEPDAPISVTQSLPQVAWMRIEIDILPDFSADDVIAATREALYGKPDLPGTGGLLRAERLGPEGVVFLSHIAAAVMGVAGVAGLRGVTFDGTPFLHYGRKPALGHFFDFGDPEAGTSRLVINGVA